MWINIEQNFNQVLNSNFENEKLYETKWLFKFSDLKKNFFVFLCLYT